MKTTESPGLAANKTEANNNVHNYFTPIHSPRQVRALTMLLDNPAGVLSFNLRQAARVMNVSDIVCSLREKGLRIDCRMVEYETLDGDLTKIGKYILLSDYRVQASALLKGGAK